ncbi:hypothetical protein O9992_30610 [Vibrio lentus]|nr:hypothetical protein [Vibrio lentus]
MTIESPRVLGEELHSVDSNLAHVVSDSRTLAPGGVLKRHWKNFTNSLLPTSESQSFVMTLVQSLQFGSSVGPVLSTLATDIRELNAMV